MKTIHLNSIFYCGLLSIFLFSCSSISHSNKESNAPLASYYYKTFRITSSKPLKGSDTTYFLITYPEFSDAKINEYVQSHLVLDSGESSIEDMGTKFIMGYDKLYDELEYKWAWYQEKKDSVQVQTDSYIGFSSNFESFTGGAHGVYYRFYNNYDLKQNKELFLDDIISQNYIEELTRTAEEIFRKQEGISKTHSLTDGYFFENGVFNLPSNFILQPEGILFLYNIYEIKPYVSGETKLLIPYKFLQNMYTFKGKEIIAELKKHTI